MHSISLGCGFIRTENYWALATKEIDLHVMYSKPYVVATLRSAELFIIQTAYSQKF